MSGETMKKTITREIAEKRIRRHLIALDRILAAYTGEEPTSLSINIRDGYCSAFSLYLKERENIAFQERFRPAKRPAKI